jgi:hypothetical protein
MSEVTTRDVLVEVVGAVLEEILRDDVEPLRKRIAELRGAGYSALAPENLTTLPHFSVSSAIS